MMIKPSPTESFSYRIPGFKLDGESLIWYASWKSHTSLYPVTPAVRRALGSDLKPYAVSKGTLRFPLDQPPPLAIVKRVVKARVAELRKS